MSSPLSSPGSESGSLEFDCLDDGEMITSFSNPNYNPDEADAINSNLPLSEYYNDNNIYENVDSNTPLMGATDSKTNTSSKGRKKYAQLDLTSMGIEGGDESLTPLSQGDLNSPDSAFSLDSRYSNGSSVTTPSERATEIVEVEHTEEQQDDDMAPYAQMPGKGFLGYYASLERSAKSRQKDKVEEEAVEAEKLENEEKEEKVNLEEEAKEETKKDAQKKYDDKCKDINSPDSNDSGIQADVHHVRGPVNEDLYAVVTKSAKPPKPQVTEDLYAVVNKSAKLPKPPLQDKNKADDDDGDDDEEEEKKEEETEEGDEKEILPSGWEKCEDDDGAYYWHIKSGTIQREPPPPPGPDDKDRARPLSITSESSLTGSVSSPSVSEEKPVASEKTPSVEPEPIKTPPVVPPKQMEDHSLKSEKSASMKRGSIDAAGDKAIRFAVRSLGWVRIMEEDLTPERSSKAVNRCIVDLSLGRNDINDVVGRWGDGKDLYMDLDKRNLTLIDPQDMSVLNVQSIQSIRVWGVGRDNGRDFAYVARDRATRKHMCHVFRCDTPARQIANTLRDICKRIMVERSLQASTTSIQKMSISRPNHLPNLEKTTDTKSSKLTSSILQGSFPTPMEEPKKVLRCHYLGATNCQKATGVEILNNSLEKLHAQVPPEKWVFVNVAVAPSTITITEYGNSERQLVECRVRFLSFMGIAMRNVKLCGFIVHTAQDQYVAHVFHCEPSAGAVCKTIEAACKLRYQKCLDAHPTSPDTLMKQNMQQQQAKCGFGASLKNVLGKVKTRKLSKS